jgi:hypothetical protein
VKLITPTRYQNAVLNVPSSYNLLLCGGRGGGKLLCENTYIPTPSGWSVLKDVKVGDTVFDEHGFPCKVTHIFDGMPDKAYRLRFSDGTHIDACGDHQWVTWTHAQKKSWHRYGKGLPGDWANAQPLTTQQIVDTLHFGKRNDLNHCIPTTGAIQMPDIDLPIDPYLLGVWLGDGTASNGTITTMDHEVLEAFVEKGFEPRELRPCNGPKGLASLYVIGPVAPHKGTPKGNRRSRWTKLLASQNLICNKHVPPLYLRASSAQRLALLQGLMDTDGHATCDKKRVEFCNTNKLLVDAVTELARSLGEKPVVKSGRATLYGKDCGAKWRVTWRAKTPCFRIKRKLDRIQGWCSQQSRHAHRMIVSAEMIEPKPMRCLMVDSPNHMYLAGEGMIPTHNSTCLHMLLLRHVEEYKDLAYALFIRESYEAIKQFEEDLELIILQTYGTRVKHNKTEHTFYFPNGGKIQLGQLADQKDYVKYQGKSYTLLIVDEYGQIANPRFVSLLMSNVRGPKGMPLRTVWAANPGGVQHGFLHSRFIAKSTAWAPFTLDDGEDWVVCPSTWRDNPNIDHAAYLRKLRAACGNDDELFKAWDTGDWNIARGAYFAGSLDERIHKLTNYRLPSQLLSSQWQPFLAGDWGSGAPGVFYICAESPGVPGFPKGSLILCDEIASYDPSDESFNTGLNWPPSKWADALHERCKRWNCPPEGVCDESYGIEESLLQKFGELGLWLIKPKKERVAGWQLVRNMMNATKERTGKPGFWASERCVYFWRTVPFLPRDPAYPEDLLTTGPDHGADACFSKCTRVTTPGGGFIEIQNIKVGDLVETRMGARAVKRTGVRCAPVLELVTDLGTTLLGTYEHPVWVGGGWSKLSSLQPGDLLTSPNGKPAQRVTHVDPVSHHTTIMPVYNLEVEDCPEYFANDILVHNCRYAAMNLGRQAFSTGMTGHY